MGTAEAAVLAAVAAIRITFSKRVSSKPAKKKIGTRK